MNGACSFVETGLSARHHPGGFVDSPWSDAEKKVLIQLSGRILVTGSCIHLDTRWFGVRGLCCLYQNTRTRVGNL